MKGLGLYYQLIKIYDVTWSNINLFKLVKQILIPFKYFLNTFYFTMAFFTLMNQEMGWSAIKVGLQWCWIDLFYFGKSHLGFLNLRQFFCRKIYKFFTYIDDILCCQKKKVNYDLFD